MWLVRVQLERISTLYIEETTERLGLPLVVGVQL